MTQENRQEQQRKERIKQDVMAKLAEADKLDGRTKEGRAAREKACVALLLALHAGVELNASDPLFQNFVHKQAWRRTMERVCEKTKTILEHLANNSVEALKLIPGVGPILSLCHEIAKDWGIDPLSNPTEHNQDLWDDFYDDIPKDGGNGPSIRRDLERWQKARELRRTQLIQARRKNLLANLQRHKHDLGRVA